MARCQHKFAWGAIRLACEKDYHPDDPQHSGKLEATTVTWLDGDRRDYQGYYTPCSNPRCIMPGGHKGNHAF